MDYETMIAMRKTRQTYRTAWGMKGQSRGLRPALPTDTHSDRSNVVVLKEYRQGVKR